MRTLILDKFFLVLPEAHAKGLFRLKFEIWHSVELNLVCMGSTSIRGAIFAQAAKKLKRRRKIVSRECTHEIIAKLFLFMDFVKTIR